MSIEDLNAEDIAPQKTVIEKTKKPLFVMQGFVNY